MTATNMKLIGYARVSSDDQNLALQLSAFMGLGIPESQIFTDTHSGKHDNRLGLKQALSSLEKGDTLVVWKLDRLWRSAKQMLVTFDHIAAVGANLHSVTEHFDMATPIGKFIITVLGGVAEYERAISVERTKAGLAAAKERGVVLGAKPRLPEGSAQWESVRRMLLAGIPGHRIAAFHGISQATIYKSFPGGRKTLRNSDCVT